MKGNKSPSPAERQSLLDWVNSLDIDSCLLATGLEDLQKGEVFLDIACMATGKKLPNAIRRRPLGEKMNLGDAICNLGLMMREFAPIMPAELRIKPVDMVQDEDALYQVLRFWREFATGRKEESPSKVPTLNLKLIVGKKQQGVLTPSSVIKSPKKSKPASLVPTPKKQTVSLPVAPPAKSQTPILRLSTGSDHRRSSERPCRVPFPPISALERSNLLSWILSLGLLPKTANCADVVTGVTSGVLLCNIVNRCEGRREAIKGVERCPRNRTAMLANVMKALGTLRGQERMKGTYLWAEKEIAKGEEDVIWGLLSDIRSLYKPQGDVSPSRSKSPNAPLSARSSQLTPKSSSLLGHSRSLSTESHQSVSRASVAAFPQPSLEDMEKEARSWLHSLGLSHLLGHEDKHVLENPFRNGVLLCEVVLRVEAGELVTVNRKPKTVLEARTNVENALAVLRTKRQEVPSALLRLGEKIAQGHSKSIWTLLWTLSLLYNSDSRQMSNSGSVYPQSAAKRLDHSLVVWMHSLGATGTQLCPQSVLDVMAGIKSGVVLCALVSRVLKISIGGVKATSREPAVALSNIRKALEPLRVNSAMCQEFVWRDKELYYGDLESVYGLLEDLHRLADRLPPRKPGNRSQTPYLGLIASGETPAAPPPERKRQKGHRTSLSASVNSEGIAETAQVLKRFRVNQVAWNADSDRIPVMERSELTPTPGLKAVFHTFDSTLARKALEGEEGWLEAWLQLLEVRFQSPLATDSLRNGVVLCQTIEKLTRSSIAGFTEYPKTTAAALNNIRKALEVLRRRPKFPREYLYVEEDVLRGNSAVIFGLFAALKSNFRAWEKDERSRYASEKSFQSRLSAILS